MAKVTIYTTPTCPYCHMAKEFFKANNIEFTEKNVGENQKDLEEMFQKSGQMGVPVIDIDGKILVGFSESALREALNIK